MKLELYLHRLLPIASILAALGSGLSVWKLFRARGLGKTITQYGTLPEIRIPMIDYITLAIAVALFIAALLEVIRLKAAAPIILVTTIGLWVHYVPAIWDQITGTMWFATKLGRSLGVTWQMLTYQVMAMFSAAF